MVHIHQLNATDQLDIVGVLIKPELKLKELVVDLDLVNHNVELHAFLHQVEENYLVLLFQNVKLMVHIPHYNATDQLVIVGVLIELELKSMELVVDLVRDNHNVEVLVQC